MLERVCTSAIGCCLALLALVQLGWMLVAVLPPGEVEYGEAVVYGHAARLLNGEPLYQPVKVDPPSDTIAIYTPVYYLAVAGLRAVAGAGFAPGRILSCVAGLATVLLVGYLAAMRAKRKMAGVFAGLLFLALGLATSRPWSAVYKEDAVGIALSVGSIAVLASGGGRSRIVSAALLAALAVLTKQSLLAAGLAGLIWLWARDRRAAALFGAVAALAVLIPALVFEITTHVFLSDVILTNVNPFSWEALLFNVRLLALYQLAPVVLAALYCSSLLRRRQPIRADLVVVYWLASIVALAGMVKVGSNYNYWIEFAAATAVVATGAIWGLPSSPRSRSSWVLDARAAAPALLLAGHLVLLIPRIPLWVVPQLRQELSGRDAASREFSALVDSVRTEPGAVLANPLDVVVLANRPIILEPFVFSMLQRQGSWDPTDLVQRICARQFSLLVLGDPLDRPDFVYQGYGVWPAPVYAALQQTMTPDSQQAGRFLYRPTTQTACHQ